MIPKDAPRCPKCGTRLPLHAVGCPEIPKPETVCKWRESDERQRRINERNSLPGRDARDAWEVEP